jgi:hypothetical protein
MIDIESSFKSVLVELRTFKNILIDPAPLQTRSLLLLQEERRIWRIRKSLEELVA